MCTQENISQCDNGNFKVPISVPGGFIYHTGLPARFVYLSVLCDNDCWASGRVFSERERQTDRQTERQADRD